MTWLLSHGKYKCVLSHPIPSDGKIPMGIPFPWTSLQITTVCAFSRSVEDITGRFSIYLSIAFRLFVDSLFTISF